MGVGDAAQPRGVFARERVDAALALQGLDQDRAHVDPGLLHQVQPAAVARHVPGADGGAGDRLAPGRLVRSRQELAGDADAAEGLAVSRVVGDLAGAGGLAVEGALDREKSRRAGCCGLVGPRDGLERLGDPDARRQPQLAGGLAQESGLVLAPRLGQQALGAAAEAAGRLQGGVVPLELGVLEGRLDGLGAGVGQGHDVARAGLGADAIRERFGHLARPGPAGRLGHNRGAVGEGLPGGLVEHGVMVTEQVGSVPAEQVDDPVRAAGAVEGHPVALGVRVGDVEAQGLHEPPHLGAGVRVVVGGIRPGRDHPGQGGRRIKRAGGPSLGGNRVVRGGNGGLGQRLTAVGRGRHHRHGAGMAVEHHPVAVFEALGGAGHGQDGGDAVLAGDHRRVGEDAAGLGDDAGNRAEERGPAGIRELGDQNLARLQAAAVLDGWHHAHAGGHDAGAAWDAHQGALGDLGAVAHGEAAAQLVGVGEGPEAVEVLAALGDEGLGQPVVHIALQEGDRLGVLQEPDVFGLVELPLAGHQAAGGERVAADDGVHAARAIAQFLAPPGIGAHQFQLGEEALRRQFAHQAALGEKRLGLAALGLVEGVLLVVHADGVARRVVARHVGLEGLEHEGRVLVPARLGDVELAHAVVAVGVQERGHLGPEGGLGRGEDGVLKGGGGRRLDDRAQLGGAVHAAGQGPEVPERIEVAHVLQAGKQVQVGQVRTQRVGLVELDLEVQLGVRGVVDGLEVGELGQVVVLAQELAEARGEGIAVERGRVGVVAGRDHAVEGLGEGPVGLEALLVVGLEGEEHGQGLGDRDRVDRHDHAVAGVEPLDAEVPVEVALVEAGHQVHAALDGLDVPVGPAVEDAVPVDRVAVPQELDATQVAAHAVREDRVVERGHIRRADPRGDAAVFEVGRRPLAVDAGVAHGRDRAGLDQLDAALGQDPLDVLGRAVVGLHAAGQGR
ncbi:hypothetical protein D3C72_724370 [compost metagenome]